MRRCGSVAIRAETSSHACAIWESVNRSVATRYKHLAPMTPFRPLALLVVATAVSLGCGDDTSGSGAAPTAGSTPSGGGPSTGGAVPTGGSGAGPVDGGMGGVGGVGGVGGPGSGGAPSGGFGGAASGGMGGAGGGAALGGAGGIGGDGGVGGFGGNADMGGSAGVGGAGGTGGEGGAGGGGLPDPCGGLESPNVLVDVGYQGTIPSFNAAKPTIKIEGDRILAGGILWDSESRTQILPANTGRQLAGDRVLGEAGLYDAVTGNMIASFAAQEPMGMTEDGDFAFYNDGTALQVIDASGNAVLDWPGNYAASFVEIVGDELRIGNGPAGPGVAERVTFLGDQTLVPFTGTFQAWFRDGQRFLTTAPGNNVRVYSADGVQEHLWPLATTPMGLAGMGNYFWTVAPPATLTVYQVGVFNAGASSGEGNLAVSQTGLVSHKSGGNFDVIVPGVSRTTYSTGILGITTMGVDPAGNWVAGTYGGLVYRHGTPSDSAAQGLLGCGGVTGIAGTRPGVVAVATSSNQLLIYSLTPSGKTLEQIIPGSFSDDMELTDDGTTLLAATGSGGAALWDLPPGTSVPLSSAPPFDFSDAGGMISSMAGVGTASDLDSYWTWAGGPEKGPPCVSPTGNGDFTATVGNLNSCVTNFFVNGVPVNTVDKCAIGWVAPNRVLMQSFNFSGTTAYWGFGGEIRDGVGNFIDYTSVVLDYGLSNQWFCPYEPAGENLAFVRHQRRLIDYTTGAIYWQHPNPSDSADRVGSFIAWEDGARVRLVPYDDGSGGGGGGGGGDQGGSGGEGGSGGAGGAGGSGGGPSCFPETCDGTDENCNGVIDDGLCGPATSQQFLHGIGFDTVKDIAYDSAGNVFIAGSSSVFSNFDDGQITSTSGYVASYDPAGVLRWKRLWGTDYNNYYNSGSSLALSNDMVCGSGSFAGTIDFGGGPRTATGVSDGVVVCMDPTDGSYLWDHAFGASSGDQALDVEISPTGDVLAMGYFSANADFGAGAPTIGGSGSNMFVVRWSATGDYLWAKVYSPIVTSAYWPESMAVDAADNAYVVGGFAGSINFGGGLRTETAAHAPFIFSLDSSGDYRWDVTQLADANATLYDVAARPDGSIVIAADFNLTLDLGGPPLSSIELRAAVVALDDSGGFLWEYAPTGTGTSRAYGVGVGPSNEVFVTGEFGPDVTFGGPTYTTGGMFVLSLDAAGQHVTDLTLTSNLGVWGQCVAVDGAGRVGVGGSAFGSVDLGFGAEGSWGQNDGFFFTL